MTKNLLIIPAIVLLAIFVWSLFFHDDDDVKARERIIKKQNYYGTVKDKYRDRENHNHLTIELENETRITLFPSTLYSEIERGDSIVKFKDSLNLRVYSDDNDYVVELVYSDYWK